MLVVYGKLRMGVSLVVQNCRNTSYDDYLPLYESKHWQLKHF